MTCSWPRCRCARLDAGLERTLRARQEWRRKGLRVIVGRLRERAGPSPVATQDEAVDALFALTAFETFDLLAGPTRTPTDVALIVLRIARAVLAEPPV